MQAPNVATQGINENNNKIDIEGRLYTKINNHKNLRTNNGRTTRRSRMTEACRTFREPLCRAASLPLTRTAAVAILEDSIKDSKISGMNNKGFYMKCNMVSDLIAPSPNTNIFTNRINNNLNNYTEMVTRLPLM